MNPYRDMVSSSYMEEELWQGLDEAISCAFHDPGMACLLLGWILQDAINLGYRRVAEAAAGALKVIV